MKTPNADNGAGIGTPPARAGTPLGEDGSGGVMLASTLRSRRTYSTKLQKDADGRTLCLECGSPILEKRRRTFCSKKCADAFGVKTSPGFARQRVWDRDR